MSGEIKSYEFLTFKRVSKETFYQKQAIVVQIEIRETV